MSISRGDCEVFIYVLVFSNHTLPYRGHYAPRAMVQLGQSHWVFLLECF